MAYRRLIGASASEDRLEKLIEDRLKPGADKERIDSRIWDLFGEEIVTNNIWNSDVPTTTFALIPSR